MRWSTPARRSRGKMFAISARPETSARQNIATSDEQSEVSDGSKRGQNDMKAFLRNRKSIIAAGAIISAAAVALLLPFKMGGCGVGGIDVGNAVGGISILAKSTSILEKNRPILG